ncbi:hypothetical protein [Halomonas dongshanensis]|uniref:Uncharacterized protein n=1 Tax=Halomonas dongshanensis TaxID=2890835 RepID=A0ABT2EA01_9GAMM|nr:hypothetical protein [Halomonas dongshanensis]MCS2608178.1 hypothetical protein [Halomonas dongshanensis]
MTQPPYVSLRLSARLTIATHILDWWVALLCLINAVALGTGLAVALLQEGNSMGWALLIAFIAGSMLHGVIVIAALGIAASEAERYE